MNILLTNDDGINAEGINALYDVFSKHHKVYIIAPEKERSGCSNAFTILKKINVKKTAGKKYSISAFPADCVNIGINGGIIPDIDLVISGINHGPNLGDDQFFSGTVAGARTAYIFGKSGIAVSIDSFHKPSEYFDEASHFFLKLVDKISPEISQGPVFLNINYPELPKSQIKGVKYTFAGKRLYRDTYERINANGDEFTLNLAGTIDSIDEEGSDITELQNGYISITPLTINCTDYEYLNCREAN